jgi:Domain of unknown function (DUF4178)
VSQPAANCPSCGAPVVFHWAGSVQTVCPFCKSILVRTDVDLAKVGAVADLPPDSSPIQIGTEGVVDNKPFFVLGRILYEYEFGAWNEWHVVYKDGASGWLSDAQLEYDVSWQVQPQPPASAFPHNPEREQQFSWGGRTYLVTSITRAHYKGVEGELPFQYWDKADVVFADLRTSDEQFGTIDYTENPPLLFLGRAVAFDDLRLKNVREFEGWRK